MTWLSHRRRADWQETSKRGICMEMMAKVVHAARVVHNAVMFPSWLV
jgi:hypothetical protein